MAHAALAAPERASAEVIARMYQPALQTDTALVSTADRFQAHLAHTASPVLAELLESKAHCMTRFFRRRSPP